MVRRIEFPTESWGEGADAQRVCAILGTEIDEFYLLGVGRGGEEKERYREKSVHIVLLDLQFVDAQVFVGWDDEGNGIAAGVDHGAGGATDIIPFVGQGRFQRYGVGIDKGAVGEPDFEGYGG